jgi:hypothetical protein
MVPEKAEADGRRQPFPANPQAPIDLSQQVAGVVDAT